MRLIDADSIRFKPYYDEYVDYDGYINDLKTWQLDDILSDRVDNTPTVKAIPIDWLRELQVRYLKADCNMSVCVVNEILNLWQKENHQSLE